MANRVELAVYDLSQGLASQMSLPLIGTHVEGIWHTGVIIFGSEYYFGGGVQKMRNGVFSRSHGMHPRQTLHMGDTDRTEAEVDAFVNSIRNRFTQHTYDLLRHNCNNFSNELIQWLFNKDIPHHILHLAHNVFSTPGGAMLRPLIEGMMGRVNGGGGGGGGDPFGGGGGGGGIIGTASATGGGGGFNGVGIPGGPTSATVSSTPAAPAPAVAPAPAPAAASAPVIPIAFQEVAFRHTLHSKDGSGALLDKIVNRLLKGATELSEAEIGTVRAVAAFICQREGQPATIVAVEADGTSLGNIFEILRKLLVSRTDLHVPCLWLLRLAVLYVPMVTSTNTAGESGNSSVGGIDVGRALLMDLVSRAQAFNRDLDLNDASTDSGSTRQPASSSFSSLTAYILALTILTNMFSSDTTSSRSTSSSSSSSSSSAAGLLLKPTIGEMDQDNDLDQRCNRLCDGLLECCFRSLHAGAGATSTVAQHVRERASELQLAGTALLFNLTALATAFGHRGHHWVLLSSDGTGTAGTVASVSKSTDMSVEGSIEEEEEEEVHPAVVQVLCSLLEDDSVASAINTSGGGSGGGGGGGVSTDLDSPQTVLRMRKLSILLMLARACSSPALLLQLRHLLLDLGYIDALQRRETDLIAIARRGHGGWVKDSEGSRIASDELSIVHELCSIWCSNE